MVAGRAIIQVSSTVALDASSDTTAIAMNNTVFQLLKHPRCLKKL